MRRTHGFAPWMAAVLLLGAGCESWVPPPVEPYFDGQLAVAEELLRPRLEQQAGDWALMANELATCLAAAGKRQEALRLFYDAGRAMAAWDTSFGESMAAMAGREDQKTYKGDPYEQAFNSIYTGILYWLRAEPDNARASFQEAILRDSASTDDRFKSDLALAFFLAAWASRDMGKPADAKSLLAEARAARAAAVKSGARGTSEPRVFDAMMDANVLVLASVGRGPHKVPGGKFGEVAVVEQTRSEVTGAFVTIGSQRLRTETLVDVYFQASTRGGRWMDGLRAGKAVFKDIASTAGVILTQQGLTQRRNKNRGAFLIAGIGAMLMSAAVSAEADVRCWRTLPDTVQAAAARVPPGKRRITIDFVGVGGRALPRFRRELTIDVPVHGTLVLHLPSIPWSAGVRSGIHHVAARRER